MQWVSLLRPTAFLTHFSSMVSQSCSELTELWKFHEVDSNYNWNSENTYSENTYFLNILDSIV